MNELIESILNNLTVNSKIIPVAYMFYEGHGEDYITYMNQDKANSLTADDELQAYADYYDFDVYTKGNNIEIIRELKRILIENGFIWQPSRTSVDMYETDTKYYHKTLNFVYLREEN